MYVPFLAHARAARVEHTVLASALDGLSEFCASIVSVPCNARGARVWRGQRPSRRAWCTSRPRVRVVCGARVIGSPRVTGRDRPRDTDAEANRGQCPTMVQRLPKTLEGVVQKSRRFPKEKGRLQGGECVAKTPLRNPEYHLFLTKPLFSGTHCSTIKKLLPFIEMNNLTLGIGLTIS